MIFRNDINLLRAISVLIVLLYHFKIPYINNGFVGVDIFFVVSGYLMTSIIFRGFDQNTFNLRKFYIGRFKRIVPALLIVVIVVFIVSFIYFFTLIYWRLAREIAYALSFISNINYFREIGYFDIDAYKKWFLHTWSLSVEFQFYLIYPLALLILKKIFNIDKLKWFILLLFVVSLGSSIYQSYANPSAAYFLLEHRAWQLLAGGLVYLFPMNIKRGALIQYVAVTLLLIFIFLPSFKNVWGGVISTVPIILAVMFLYANNSSTYLSKNKALHYIGLWSYSIYLWHWVVVVFLFHYGLLDNSYYVAIGIVLSILFGAVSYHTVERNFRYKGRIVLVVFIAVLITSSIVYKKRSLNLGKNIEIAGKLDDSNLLINEFDLNTKYIVIGDSHADALAGMFNTLSKDKDISVFSDLTHTGTGYIIVMDYDSISNKKDTTVFLIRKWDNLKLDSDIVDFKQTVKAMSDNFKKVIIMQQVPLQPMNTDEIYIKNYKGGKIINEGVYNSSVSLSEHFKHNSKSNSTIYEDASKYNNVVVIDPTPYLCDNERCPVGDFDKPYYKDDDHLNGNGAMKLLPLFEPFFDRDDESK